MLVFSSDLDVGTSLELDLDFSGSWMVGSFYSRTLCLFKELMNASHFIGLGSFFSGCGCLDFDWIWISFVADTKM